MRRYLTVLLLLAAAFGGAACDEKLADLAGPTPNLVPTFASIQKEIFNTTDSSGRLACINCHTDNGRTPAGGLLLTDGRSYQALVGVGSRVKAGAVFVVPGDPDTSYLIHKLDGSPDIVGSRMPRGTGPYVTPGQMQIIRRWIALGAKND